MLGPKQASYNVVTTILSTLISLFHDASPYHIGIGIDKDLRQKRVTMPKFNQRQCKNY